MAAQARNLDSQFYQPADAFFPAHTSLGLTFDDLTLATHYSEILPRDTRLETRLADWGLPGAPDSTATSLRKRCRR